jgi:hypothetical protein
VAEVDIDTWVSSLAIVSAMFALYFSLRRELRDQFDGLEGRLDGRIDGLGGRIDGLGGRIDGLDGRVDGLEARIEDRFTRLENRLGTLDDRIYGLAVGLKPVIDEAAARAQKA